jgi:glutaminyl-peptide cyclotransferase
MKNVVLYFILFTFFISCSSDPKTNQIETVTPKTEELVPSINFEVLKKIPHDINSFTEGLLFHNGELYESTGSPENLPQTKSVIGIIDSASGKINTKVDLGRKYFGEGITILDDKIYQLTYKNQIGFVYNAKTYKQVGQFGYKNREGWGMTTDGTSLIMSDGTNVLTYIDPVTLKPIKTINVTNAGYAEDFLNELEFIDGFIYANIWTKNYVVKIDSNSGKVVGILDFSTLSDEARNKNPEADVLNGIAYDPLTKNVYVTGKMFPFVFVLKLR